MRILYTIGIWFYGLGIRMAALFSEKARLWVHGRKGLLAELGRTFSGSEHPLWVHCASLGEYEQAKPLIEKFKQEHPDIQTIATFFSPSGYIQALKKPLADHNFYLPLDLPGNAKRFLDIVRPRIAVFVKYEFWFNYMRQLHKNNTPFYYISAIFREKQHFFKPFGRWFANQLKQASHFFVQTKKSEELLESIDIHQVTVCGDTRFDRVKAIAAQVQPIPFMESFCNGRKTIVAGSTWGPDEHLLAQLLQVFPDYKLVVAPHEINRSQEVKETFSTYRTASYSSREECDLTDTQVLIIDTVGILNRLYQYSYVSFIGGAFKTGLHNTLEAAVYGKPIFFGPHYKHFNEAVQLVEREGAFSVNSVDEMKETMTKFEINPDYYAKTCQICQDYVAQNSGACDKIYNQIKISIQ